MPPKKAAALPSKERALFANLLQDYEKRKYKLGLKTADTILKKVPEHGETLAMKGLILASCHRKQEGLELAKKGLRFDLGSFICWHALGIIYRMDRNYAEAIKSYTRALHIDGSNINLLRELAFMYMQERNYGPLIDHRLTLLRVQPHWRTTWTALAVAHHAAGSLDEAIRVIEAFESTFRDVPKRYFEQSEIRLYLASLYEEAGRPKDVVAYLSKFGDDDIVDYAPRDELLARAQQKLGNSSEADKLWQKLFRRNPEEKSYVLGLLEARGTKQGSSSASDILDAFKTISSSVSRSNVARRQLLSFLPAGDEFKAEADAYLLAAIQRGVPSLFNDLKSLYSDTAKRDTIQSIAESYRAQWSSYAAPSSSSQAASQESPSSLLWLLYFLAQHYSSIQNGDAALEAIDAAIAHSPTLPELYLTRARILKRLGDLEGAAHAMESGRLLDGQDRYMNSKGALYQLRIGNVEEAVKVVGLFTRPTVDDPVEDLLEMQALWYLLEEGQAWERKGVLNMALKRFDQVDKLFQEHYEDQMDFHTYCLRKVTLRSYMTMIRWLDQVRNHPAYFRAALATIDLSVRLHDDPSLRTRTPEARQLADRAQKAADEAAAKAAKLKAEKEKKSANGKGAAASAAAAEEEEPPAPKDQDPYGFALLAKEKPLEEALRHVKVLQVRADQRVETWLATFEVAIRRKAWLEASRALHYAKALDPNHPDLHVLFIRLAKALPSLEDDSLPAHVRPALKSTLDAFNPSQLGLEELAQSATQQHANSAPHVLASAQALVEVRGGEGAKEAVYELALQLARPEYNASLATLRATQALLKRTAQPQERLDAFNKAASQRWPLASAFHTPAEREERARARAAERASWDAATDGDDGAPTSSAV